MRAPTAAAQADLHVVALSERLFLDDDDKDITFELSDGSEGAHKAVLNAASDVFKQMLKSGMSETTSGIVKLPDVSKLIMRVFLRLLYTGRVDSSDWAGTEKVPRDNQLVLKQAKVQRHGRRLTSGAASRNRRNPADYFSVALLAGGGAGDFEFVARSEDWEGIALGIAPRDSSLDELRDEGNICTCEIDRGHLEYTFAGCQWLEVPAGAELTVKLQNRVLFYAVNGGDFVESDFGGTRIRANVDYAPLVSFYSAGQSVEIVSISPSTQCPLDVLIGATLQAKKYMVTKVLDVCTLVLKERLVAAKEQKDVGAFEEIWVAAISGDMFNVRVAAQQAAKDGFAELRTKHHEGSLHPVVSQDMQDIWPSPPAKRRRTTVHLS